MLVPSPPNPARIEVELRVAATCQALGLSGAESYHVRGRVGHLTAAMYPRVSPDVLEAIHLIALWSFFYDDAIDRRQVSPAALSEACRQAIRHGAPTSAHPIAAMLSIARAQICALGRSVAWLERLCASIEAFTRTSEHGAHLDASGETRSLDDYLRARRYDITMPIANTLAELCCPWRLQEAQLSDPDLRRAREAACMLVCYVNDLHSYPREVLEEGSGQNAVVILQHQERLTLQDAIGRAGQEARAWERALHDSACAVACSNDAAARAYILALREATAAVVSWTMGSQRYLRSAV